MKKKILSVLEDLVLLVILFTPWLFIGAALSLNEWMQR